MACGTASGTLGADFDASATLDIVKFNATSGKRDDLQQPVGSATSLNRFTSIAWGLTGSKSETLPLGIIAGGLDSGVISFWNADKLVKGEGDDSVVCAVQKHQGAVQGIDFNPYQHQFLASGGADSEVYIWDLTRTDEPGIYSPGQKTTQSTADITCVQWNRKVQHILATTASAGNTVIWDLKVKRSVISFNDKTLSARCRSMAWHPSNATQLVTGAESDERPVIQLWDLRNTYSPLRYLEGHQRGVWTLSWNEDDPSLLLSSGKDARTLCWDVDTGRVLCELDNEPSDNNDDASAASADNNSNNGSEAAPVDDGAAFFGQLGGGGLAPADAMNARGGWNFDVRWASGVSGVFSTCSLEGRLAVHSAIDTSGGVPSRSTGTLADAAAASSLAPPDFTRAPTWLRRPAGVSFGFGGRLVSFVNSPPTKANTPATRSVQVKTIVTQPKLVEQAEKLHTAVTNNDLETYCNEKLAAAENESEKSTWIFIRNLFHANPRAQILDYLGYAPSDVQAEVKRFVSTLSESSGLDDTPGANDTADDKKVNGDDDSSNATAATDVADADAATEADTAAADSDADPFAALDAAADSADAAAFDAVAPAVDDTAKSTPEVEPVVPLHLFKGVDDDGDRLITQALIVGNFEAAVDLCIRQDRIADALVLAACAGSELWARTQEAYFRREKRPVLRLLAAVVKGELARIVSSVALDEWRAALAVVCTYAKPDEFAELCRTLGARLEQSDTRAATLCYLCAGDLDRTLAIWASGASLQSVIEKVTVFTHSLNRVGHVSPAIAERYRSYAELLAGQGALAAAMRFLLASGAQESDADAASRQLVDRLYNASAQARQECSAAPAVPYERQEVTRNIAPSAAQLAAQAEAEAAAAAERKRQADAAAYQQQQAQLLAQQQAEQRRVQQQQQLQQQQRAAPINTGFVPNTTHNNTSNAHVNNNNPTGFVPTTTTNQPQTTAPRVSTTFMPQTGGNQAGSSRQQPPSSSSAAAAKAGASSNGNATSRAGAKSKKGGSTGKEAAKPKPVSSPLYASTVAQLDAALSDVKANAGSTGQRKKKSDDVVKRLSVLRESIDTAQMDGAAVEAVTQFLNAVAANNLDAAMAHHKQLTSQHWDAVGQAPMVGLKRLVELKRS
eukprot:CAMPEP_0168594394 /NCGR_PEP_ID=MMETSP0420-20121227/8875_1 /TAXON_ID=498008 /ORGANISM="Pessonella sp." /LENGTH=1134 /DNA_ID=CAMNT_0008630711 /DNA_START=214 /DNA_END=3615 /DNA_ORIENTATION=-